jgi:SH3 domain-containing protein
VTSAANAYLLPDASRTPLATLPAGTTVKILDQTGEWLKVEFADQRFGPRVGYVSRTQVKVSK